MLQFTSFKDYASQYSSMPRQNKALAPKVSVRKTIVPRSASYGERRTIAQFDYTSKPNTIKLMRLDNGYKTTDSFEDKEDMHKRAWYVLHSPKLYALTIKTNYYSNDINSMIRFCEMNHIPVDIITRNGKLHSSKEFCVWSHEVQQAKDEFAISAEVSKLLSDYAPELLKYARRGSDELIEVLRQQIKNSAYDVDMQSLFVTDGLNSGKIDDSKGIHEWSRTYTKHYNRYNQTLKDLLLMYISCKFFKKAEMNSESKDTINTEDVDSYTGASLTTVTTEEFIRRARMVTLSKMEDPHTYAGIEFDPSIATLNALEEDAEFYCAIHNMSIEEPFIKPREESTVIERSACGLYVQYLMN